MSDLYNLTTARQQFGSVQTVRTNINNDFLQFDTYQKHFGDIQSVKANINNKFLQFDNILSVNRRKKYSLPEIF